MVESTSIHEHIHAQPIITTHLTGWLICIVLELLRFLLRLQLVAPSRLRNRFFIAMARLWVGNVCISGMSLSKGGISPCTRQILPNVSLNGIVALLQLSQVTKHPAPGELFKRKKGFWSALPVIYELSILLTEKLIE